MRIPVAKTGQPASDSLSRSSVEGGRIKSLAVASKNELEAKRIDNQKPKPYTSSMAFLLCSALVQKKNMISLKTTMAFARSMPESRWSGVRVLCLVSDMRYLIAEDASDVSHQRSMRRVNIFFLFLLMSARKTQSQRLLSARDWDKRWLVIRSG